MKRVRGLKRPTPGLKAYLTTAGANAIWKDFRKYRGDSARIELVERLARRQRGLCAYCEVSLRDDDRLIEHFVPVSHPVRGARLSLDHRNMLASCQGGTRPHRPGARVRVTQSDWSCDKAKRDFWSRDLLDPRRIPAAPSLFLVRADGVITSDERACGGSRVRAERVRVSIEVLNLNAPRLRLARRTTWEALSDLWGEELSSGRLVEEAIRAELLPLSGQGMDPYFTTRRSFFQAGGAGILADTILAANRNLWI